MSDGSTIEWLNWPGYKPASWNSTKGCTRVSEGCCNCYAEIMAARFSRPGQWGHGIAEMRGGDHRWTGVVELDEAKLLLPLKWKQPRCVFVNSTSDLFHEKLPDEAIDKVFAMMALCPQHLFICLTKRAERMREWFDNTPSAKLWRCADGIACAKQLPESHLSDTYLRLGPAAAPWPLPNIVLGVSVEDQPTADERIPHLLATRAACRMVSAEPLLGPTDFVRWLPICRVTTCHPDHPDMVDLVRSKKDGTHIDWVVAGGESGPGARPAHPEWYRSLRDQCAAAGVAFFFKQWGEFAPSPDGGLPEDLPPGRGVYLPNGGGKTWRFGKKAAGRLLDGREHNEFPHERPVAR